MAFIENLNWEGLGIGLFTFLIIGLFHPLVIKGEYYLGRRVNIIFAVVGIVASLGALLVTDTFWAAILAVVGFSSFWSIKEVIEQEKRVKKGWFPSNPRRH